MRQAGESRQSGQRRLRVDADRLAQRQCCHRVGRVVATDEAQAIELDQLLLATHDGAVDQTVVERPRRRVEPEGDDAVATAGGGKAALVVAVEDHGAAPPAAAREDAVLRRGVAVHSRVAVEMVFGNVEQGSGVGTERRRRLELEARQLEHPYRRQSARSERAQQRVERRRTDVAAGDGRPAGGTRQRGGEGGRRRLAVAAGDRQDARLRVEFGERVDEELDLGDDRNPGCQRLLHQRRRQRDSRRQDDARDAVQEAVGERAADELRVRCGFPEFGQAGRRAAAVGDAHARAGARQPACCGQPALAEAEDELDSFIPVHGRPLSAA